MFSWIGSRNYVWYNINWIIYSVDMILNEWHEILNILSAIIMSTGNIFQLVFSVPTQLDSCIITNLVTFYHVDF